MKLFYRQAGQGQPLIILHGLFGSSDNWYSLSKVFSESFTVYTVDQRNHGQSPHSDEFDYKLLTEDLEEFLQEHAIKDPIVIGHSMGGKTAMNLAIKNPSLIQKLIVVDIAPKSYPVHHDQILDGLTAIPIATLASRNEADTILAKFVPELDVRQFLLKNLSRNSNGKFEWKINVSAIEKHIEEIGQGMQYEGTFAKPTLFIKGARSNYFKPGDDELILKLFPAAKMTTLDTGHWVQAEKPQEFVQSVLNFLNN
ncbi:MAG: alpha/beta fold hydrolase [Cyclobacteriaceae bacterium]